MTSAAFITCQRTFILLNFDHRTWPTLHQTLDLYHTLTRYCESVVRTPSKVNGKCHISGSPSTEILGSIFKKIARLITSGTSPHRQVLRSVGSKAACLSLSGVYFFSFLPARRYASAGLCDSDVSGRLSVRLSHAGIVPSRAKAGS